MRYYSKAKQKQLENQETISQIRRRENMRLISSNNVTSKQGSNASAAGFPLDRRSKANRHYYTPTPSYLHSKGTINQPTKASQRKQVKRTITPCACACACHTSDGAARFAAASARVGPSGPGGGSTASRRNSGAAMWGLVLFFLVLSTSNLK